MKIEIELNNLTAEEQETVRQLAEKKKPYWVPKNGERYFFILSDATFDDSMCHCDIMDDGAVSIGNYFKTEKEARQAITRLQMQTKWKRLSLEAGEATNPWDEEHEHHFVYWSYSGEEICFYRHYFGKCGQTYFPSEESIKAAIAELGEENVKKYILGVEE